MTEGVALMVVFTGPRQVAADVMPSGACQEVMQLGGEVRGAKQRTEKVRRKLDSEGPE